MGQVQLPADTTPGAEYQLDSVAEVGHDPEEGAADPIFVGVHINDQELLMELDTGAKFSVIPEKIWKDKWPELSLSSCDVRSNTYDGTIVPILGEAFVSVNYSGKCIDLRAIVVKSGKYALFGRDWLHAFRPHWMNSIHLLHPSLKSVNVEPSEKNVEHAENLDAVRNFPEVFDERLGCISGCEATIYLQDGAVPKCIPARPVPYALRSKVDNELDRWEREGVIHKIEFAEWASPIVFVKKKNGDVRLCADFKVSISKYIDPQQHPIPSPTDLLSTLSGGQLFTKLDLRQAYTQLPLSSESQKYCVISTHRCLYAYTHLPFGVSSAPAIWQRVVEQIVAGIPDIICYFDDLLISGANQAEHDERLREVLMRFEKYGVRVGEEKCEFLKEEVKYLGYTVSNEGIQPDTEKVEAIVNAPAPESVQSLQSFLGMVNFYGRFIENLSSLLSPFYALLKKGCTWKWSADCQASFEEVKRKLADSPVLMHFDPQLHVVVEADASPYGIGACLSHVLPDESRRPVFFVSRALTSAERSYSQVDKEGLAIVFGVRRPHQFVFGRHFILRTDQKPLVKIFGEHIGLSSTVAARLQRWALILSRYDYHIEFIRGCDNVVADCLSRLPVPLSPEQEDALLNSISAFSIDPCGDRPVTAAEVATATREDPCLSKVLSLVRNGWSSNNDEFASPYFKFRDELSIEFGCVLRGSRVVIPALLRESLLRKLHSSHFWNIQNEGRGTKFFSGGLVLMAK